MSWLDRTYDLIHDRLRVRSVKGRLAITVLFGLAAGVIREASARGRRSQKLLDIAIDSSA